MQTPNALAELTSSGSVETVLGSACGGDRIEVSLSNSHNENLLNPSFRPQIVNYDLNPSFHTRFVVQIAKRMSHATSHTISDAEASMPQNEIAQHLTRGILTLQQTIRNIRNDVVNGIAPSVLTPVDSVSNCC
jgi:hypothetical protein